ncbi:MAG: hypothetical protein K5866_03010 [Treponema sp.]|nr:hypothetical protein [Treponema sp.]
MKRFLLSLAILSLSFSLAFADSKYYTGSTGSDIILAIPEGHCTNLAPEQEYFMVLLQTQLTDAFHKYSPITVVDRQNESIADQEIANAENGSYSDKGYAEFGKKLNAQYVAIPNLIGTGINFSLSIRIIKTEENKVVYSYNNNSVSATAIKNGSAINLAVKNLLDQMGIVLTDAGEKEILGTVDSNTLKAQENLSRGINASKRGTTVEAMQYYYEAAEYNVNNTEINQRLSQIQSAASTGNIGDKLRSEQEIYNYWKKTLYEADEYFEKNPPYQVVYSTKINQKERTTEDFEKEVVTLQIQCGIYPTLGAQKAVQALKEGIEASPEAIKESFSSWPERKTIKSKNTYNNDNDWYYPGNCEVTIQILNDLDRVIGSVKYKNSNYYYRNISFNTKINQETLNDTLRTISIEDVNINKITDNLIIKISSIEWNGSPIPLEKIQISTKEEIERQIKIQKEEERRIQLAKEEEEKRQQLEREEKERRQQLEKEAREKARKKELALNRNSGALNVEVGLNSYADSITPLLTFDYNKAIKGILFWGLEGGLGLTGESIEDTSKSDEHFSFHALGEVGLNCPLFYMTCVYVKAGAGFSLNHSAGGDTGLLLRGAAGLDWSLLTFQYALDYVTGGYFSDRFTIGLIWNSSIVNRLE